MTNPIEDKVKAFLIKRFPDERIDKLVFFKDLNLSGDDIEQFFLELETEFDINIENVDVSQYGLTESEILNPFVKLFSSLKRMNKPIISFDFEYIIEMVEKGEWIDPL